MLDTSGMGLNLFPPKLTFRCGMCCLRIANTFPATKKVLDNILSALPCMWLKPEGISKLYFMGVGNVFFLDHLLCSHKIHERIIWKIKKKNWLAVQRECSYYKNHFNEAGTFS